MNQPALAVIFDMDGVLTDTAALHCDSWIDLAREEGLAFAAADYEPMRGLAREESLRHFLGSRFEQTSEADRRRLMRRKQELFEKRMKRLSAGDRLPGVTELIAELQRLNIACAVASSSRNTAAVLKQIGLGDFFGAVVDANSDMPSKPAPALFLEAARRLGVSAAQCVVIEDAAAGVEAAHRAGMLVVGVGPAGRVGKADLVVQSLAGLNVSALEELRKRVPGQNQKTARLAPPDLNI